MMGWIVLVIIIVVEIGMMGYGISVKKNIKKERAAIRIGVFGAAVLLTLTGIIKWNFSVFVMYLVLLLLTIYSIVILINQTRGKLKIKDYTIGRTIHHTIQMILLIGFSVIPMLIFPQHGDLETTGHYEYDTALYTWTDESRIETLSKKNGPEMLLWNSITQRNTRMVQNLQPMKNFH